ncbi:hypothetical protein RvY_09922 [Ramazzottius varieornatus]|uniref:Uncharacterized protein n=1 Tax=Ramazzottius varieornatus TaxID=947166 RepID=A0A1D1VFH9_RAMVA|nr:hypothetical protein RvY_09922 [Ramazzottius varieornatus]
MKSFNRPSRYPGQRRNGTINKGEGFPIKELAAHFAPRHEQDDSSTAPPSTVTSCTFFPTFELENH